MRKPTDREVIETMQHGARNEPRRVLYDLLAGAGSCGPAARSVRLSHDNELADFLLRMQEEIVGEAKRLLQRRLAE